MSIREGAGGAPAQPDRDTIENLLLEIVGARGPLREARLAALCEQHPDLEAVLQRRYAFLRDAGLLDPGADAAASSGVPERLGGFRLLERLGQGGMGVVYLAEQESLGRRVALKVIQPGAAAPPHARERFRREVHAVSLLDHPNICPVHDAGEIDGVPYLAMRYVEGETLAERIARERAATTGTATPTAGAAAIEGLVAMGEQLARALHAAHNKGLVHRDVKPGNVMLEVATGKPLLLDFGLARLDDEESPTLTLSGDRLGTPAYMAPEQVAGQAADRRTDVYALGATLYEALTGHVPHQAPTREALYQRILSTEVTAASRHNPRVSRDLEVVLATALDRNPDRRYRTAAEFADDLGRVLRREPILARPPSVWLRTRRWCQRNPSAAAALGVLAAGLALSVWLLLQWSAAAREKDATLLVRESLDLRGANPRAALVKAWKAVELDPIPRSVAALRAALHAPQVEAEIDPETGIGQAFDADPSGSLIAWADAQKNVWVHRDGRTDHLGSISGVHPVFCLRLSPDGTRVAVAGNDAPVLVYSLDSGPTMVLPPPEPAGEHERVFTVAWHPTRNVLAVGTGDAEVRKRVGPSRVHLWNLDTQEVCSRVVGGWPWHMKFVDEDRLIVAPGSVRWPSNPVYEHHNVELFALGERLERLRLHDKHDQPCMEMAVSGPLVATVGHDQRLVIWNWQTGEEKVFEHPKQVYSVDFAPDGQALATACHDGKVRLFDRDANPIGTPWRVRGSRPVESAVFDTEGRRLVVRVWDRRLIMTRNGRELAEMPASGLVVRAERFLPDGRLLTFDHLAIRSWRLEPDDLAHRFVGRDQRPLLSPDGSLLLTVDLDGRAELSERGNSTPLWRQAVPPFQLCLDNEGRVYGADVDRRLIIVSPEGIPCDDMGGSWSRPIFYLGCAPRGALVAGSVAGDSVRIVKMGLDGTWKTVAHSGMEELTGQPQGVSTRFCWYRGPSGGWHIVVGSFSGIVEFAYADDQLTMVGKRLLPKLYVKHVAISPDGQLMYADLGEKGGQLFCLYDGSWRIRAPIPFSAPIVHVAFATDNRLLLTSAEETRIYDDQPELVGVIPRIDSVGFLSAHGLPGGEKVLTIAANYVMREWWIDDNQVMAEAGRLLDR